VRSATACANISPLTASTMRDEAALTLPSQHYQAGIARGEWELDPAQHAVLAEFDRLHRALTAPPPRWQWWRRRLGQAVAAPPGLYLWGGVGRGKTFLVDLFYQHLPLPVQRPYPHAVEGEALPPPASGGKYRTHFHRFMQGVHALLREHAGERDPLTKIVAHWRTRLRVLVLDEFFVSDIGDAMLLARLLQRMVAEGIVLVTTSNARPAALYQDGLQRARFLPAIALLEQHCHVCELRSPTDYRLRTLTRSPVYRTPLDAHSEAWLGGRWKALGGSERAADVPHHICIDTRHILVRARGGGMLWCDFTALCEGPRAAADYIQIATEFHTVLLAGIPVFDGHNDDAARRCTTAMSILSAPPLPHPRRFTPASAWPWPSSAPPRA